MREMAGTQIQLHREKGYGPKWGHLSTIERVEDGTVFLVERTKYGENRWNETVEHCFQWLALGLWRVVPQPRTGA